MQKVEVNPQVLSWARETAGLTQEEASKKLGFKDAKKRTAVERLVAYETGQDFPSRSVLVKMAKHYHRSLLTFYLDTPPLKGDRGADFRTLSDAPSAIDAANLDVLIRGVQARQSMVRAVLEDEDEATPLPFVNSRRIKDGKSTLLQEIQSLLDVTLRDYRSKQNARASFNLLRNAAEKSGVFVLLIGDLGSHHTAIDVDVFRGFTIADEIAPFVVINPRDAIPAWSFTLLHELVHLILGQTGVGNSYADSDVERFCNDVAGEFLLPDSEVKNIGLKNIAADESEIELVEKFADKHNLSRTMIAYKAYRVGDITRERYQSLSELFRQTWLEQRKSRRERRSKGGPSYYVMHRHRAGDALVALVERMMSAGALSTTKAARILEVKPDRIQEILQDSR